MTTLTTETLLRKNNTQNKKILNAEVNIISLDPSSTNTGWAYWEGGRLKEYGCITLPNRKNKGQSITTSLTILYDAVFQLMLKYDPQKVIIEDVFAGKFACGIIQIVRANGVCILASGMQNDTVILVHPSTWKKAIIKEGRHNKANVKKYIYKNFPELKYKKHNQDVLDAVGIGYWYYCCGI